MRGHADGLKIHSSTGVVFASGPGGTLVLDGRCARGANWCLPAHIRTSTLFFGGAQLRWGFFHSIAGAAGSGGLLAQLTLKGIATNCWIADDSNPPYLYITASDMEDYNGGLGVGGILRLQLKG